MKKNLLVILGSLALSMVSQATSIKVNELKLSAQCQSHGPAVSTFVSPKLTGKMIYMDLYLMPNEGGSLNDRFVAVIKKSDVRDLSRRTEVVRIPDITRLGPDLAGPQDFSFKSGYFSNDADSINFSFEGVSNHIAAVCRNR